MEKTIQLFSGTGQPISGNICTMTEEHLHEVQTIWEPMLVATQQPDEGWGWTYKLRQSQQEQRYETYVIEAEDFTQGILFIETQWHPFTA